MKKIFIITLLLFVISFEISAEVSKYTGDWIGTGWGWEVRFKQTSGEFASQFIGRRDELPFGNEKIIMTLLVEHSTVFHIYVDENNNVTGEGTITYGLIPNLAGVAALTKQVNDAINLMDKVVFVFKLAADIGKQAVQSMNRVYLESEAKLAQNMNAFSKISAADLLREGENKVMITNLMKSGGQPDAVELAKAVLWNRSFSGGYNLANGVDASLFVEIPGAVDYKSLGDFALDQVRGKVLDEIAKTEVAVLERLLGKSKREEQLCLYAAGIPSIAAGTQIGPSTVEQLLTEFGPEIAKAAFFDILVGRSMPTGLILSIPGVTQVQYHYKGLKDGPESRRFKIRGKIADGKLYLDMDGDVDGDKNLYVQYTVNYQKSTHSFPTWSPFMEEGADVSDAGECTVYDRETNIEVKQYYDKKEKKYKKIEFERDRSIPKKMNFETPFAFFHEKGKQRNNVKVWHEYEYNWRVFKLTEPKQ
jgi:hypothetical protein